MAKFVTGKTVSSPSQIFKARDAFFNALVLVDGGTQIVNFIDVRETGTTYALKVDVFVHQDTQVTGDVNRVDLFASIEKANAGIQGFETPMNTETLNGFYVGSVWLTDGDASGGEYQHLREKFRFRRKVDENMEIRLTAFNTSVIGSATVRLSGRMRAIIRTR